ncbi:MAG: DUF4276 family protein [Planctomycetes bacterium]|nr:DUF4276 family protein [Planctomycetota bacterium]
MVRIASIVEGHGEVHAVPMLVRRIIATSRPGEIVELPRPIPLPRQRLLKEGELERAVELAARKSGKDKRILILLDADDDCPAALGSELLRRARIGRGDCSIQVVLANMEYEAWFLAAATSIANRRDLPPDLEPPPDPESIRDAKGWLSARMPPGRSYRETRDQVALSALFDLDLARAAPSFDKLVRDVLALLPEPGSS